MKLLSKIFLSYYFVIFMLIVLGASAGIATFIENDYGTQSAKVLVYNARWYEAVMILLAISLVAVIYKRKMWKRLGAFVFHIGFVVILLGAGLTRYFGQEGVLHIREGRSERNMITEASYLQIEAEEKLLSYPLALTKLGNNDFKINDKIENKEIQIAFQDYKYTKKEGGAEKLIVDVKFNGVSKVITINGGHGSVEFPTMEDFKKDKLSFSWGSKIIELPFEIKLVDFQLERYPGSMSASSYNSQIELKDKDETISYNIFMNHPLTYNGYKFFQSSYDQDELGTILEVNKDPGKWPTYIGYALLSLGFLLNFFTKGSRFQRLRKFLKHSSLSILMIMGLFLNTPLKAAGDTEYLKKFDLNTLNHMESFETLLVQDYNGRIKPISTEALDILHKLSNKDGLYGLNASQIMIGIIGDPNNWNNIKLIKISNKKIKKLLNIDENEKYVAFNNSFDQKGLYKLKDQLASANKLAPGKRGTFERDIIKFDERLNVYYLTAQGMFFKFIPRKEDLNQKWASPQEVIQEGWQDSFVEDIYTYMDGLIEGIDHNNWTKANQTIEKFKALQKELSSDILPDSSRVKVEVLFNKLKIFQNLITAYMLLGFIILILALLMVFFKKRYPKTEKILLSLLFMAFIGHTVALSMRWYISGHAPWSDTYESLIYIGWSGIFAGLVVFRRSLLALSASAMLGGIIMLVAHLSFISPQITNLVPVLKSYWLSIHVSIITASYGFFGLSFLLGCITLLLMALKNNNNKEFLSIQIRELSAINEISLIIGLSLLTVGNFIGGVWANESWGRYWGWDSKETWAFVSIVVYTIVLHLRFIPKFNSIYALTVASVVSFATILMTYFGVNFYLSGLHSYATGDKVPIPSFVYYTTAMIILMIVTAYRGRDVKNIK